jgi:Xaa-Pro aminopeptidase
MIVATGERSQLPNVGPTERVLKPGDVCRVEIFPVIDGYQAGVCRTAVVGDPPPEAERIYRNLVECKYLVRDAIRPGARAHGVYDTFFAKFNELGMPPISFVGHSIGVNLHERPYLGPHGIETLRAGMVLGMEPLVYRSGHGFGMQIKDMVVVTDDGCRLLSDVSDTDRLHRIEA